MLLTLLPHFHCHLTTSAIEGRLIVPCPASAGACLPAASLLPAAAQGDIAPGQDHQTDQNVANAGKIVNAAHASFSLSLSSHHICHRGPINRALPRFSGGLPPCCLPASPPTPPQPVASLLPAAAQGDIAPGQDHQTD